MDASIHVAFNPIWDLAFKVWRLFILFNHGFSEKTKTLRGVAELLQS